MAQVLISQGKYILAGAGGFLSVPAGSGGGTPPQGGSGTTSLTLSDFYSSHQYARPVIQRSALSMNDPAGPWADVPVLYSFTGTAPTYPQARVVDAGSGSPIVDWTTLTNIQTAGSTGLGTLPKVPQGGYYTLQIRDGQQIANSATTSNGTKAWGVGVQIIPIGQSNMASTLKAGQYNDAVGASDEYTLWFGGSIAGTLEGASGCMHPNGNGTPDGGSSAPSISGGLFAIMRIVSSALQAKYGKLIPVSVCPWAFNSNGIDQFIPTANAFSPSSNKIDLLFKGSATAASGTMGNSGYVQVGFASPKNYAYGDFEVLAMHQGEANSDGTMTRATYFGKLQQVYQGALNQVSQFGRTAQNLAFLPAVLGGNTAGGYAYVERMRGAVLDLDAYAKANNWPLVRAGWHCIDLIPQASNPLHFEDVDSARQYQRWAVARLIQAILWALGCSSYHASGPRITSVSRSVNTATLTVTHNGGSSLVTPGAGSPTGFYANTASDFSGSSVAIASVSIASANTITVTFSGSPSYPVYLKYAGGADGSATSQQPDMTNPIYDNAAMPNGANVLSSPALSGGGRAGFPMMPTPDAIQVN